MKVRFFLSLLLCISGVHGYGQRYEKDYADIIQTQIGGQREYAVTSGYVDLLTDTHAIEIEWANEWKEAIGQSLWYSLQTNKRPGIILIVTSPSEYKYAQQLQSVLDYNRIEIDVWLYPEDFQSSQLSGGAAVQQLSASPSVSPAHSSTSSEGYWLTKSSRIRHNARCRYYERTRGEYCSRDIGTACKKCGG